jgi:hypothetical protein
MNGPGTSGMLAHRDWFMLCLWTGLWVCSLVVWTMAIAAGAYYAPFRALLLFTAVTTWILSFFFIPYYYLKEIQSSLLNAMGRLRPLTRLCLEMFPLLVYLVFWSASTAIAGSQACRQADASFYYCNTNSSIFAFTFLSLVIWITLTFWFTFKLLRNSAAYL